MASIQISGWSGSGNRTLRLTVVEIANSQDYTNNTSKVLWTLEVLNDSVYYDTYVQCWVNGKSVYDVVVKAGQGFPDRTGAIQGTEVIQHNSDGTKTISFGIQGYVFSYVNRDNFNGSLTLKTITQNAPNVTATGYQNQSTASSLVIGSTSDVLCDQWAYRIRTTGSYGNWVFKSASAASERNTSWTLTSLASNTTYTIQTAGRDASTGVWGWSNELIMKTLGPSSITSAANITLGSACSIKWTPIETSYKFKLTFQCGNTSVVVPSSASSYISPNITSEYTYSSYQPPLSTFAPELTKSTSGSMTITLTTYTSDGTAIGTSSKVVTCTIPDDSTTRPTLGTVTITNAGNTTFGSNIYVRLLSSVKATISGSSAKYGATITRYSMSVGSDSYTSTTGSITSSELSTAGSKTVTVSVTDSRGLVSSTTSTITVLDYFKPTGSISYTPNGKSIDTTITWRIAPVLSGSSRLNRVNVKIERTKLSTGTKTVKTVKNATSAAADFSSTYTWTAADQALTDADMTGYRYVLTVYDKIGTSFQYTATVTTAITALSFLRGGTGACFFGEATDNGLEVKGTAHVTGDATFDSILYAQDEVFTDSNLDVGGNLFVSGDLYFGTAKMADFITETGTDSLGWRYDKYNSGKILLYRDVNVGKPSLSTYGSFYYTSPYTTLPSGMLTAVNTVQATPRSGTGLWLVSIKSITTSRIDYFLANSKNEAPDTVYVSFCVEGRWK